ncbi:MAG: dTMP kinase [Clostridia bacterium]|nr:dTMP kinase [Clostridia bacterium]
MSGKLIVLEGIDGAGKSTQLARLAEALTERGYTVSVTAEPTELESGKALRRALSGADPKSECQMATMFVADRIAHNLGEDGIARRLERGEIVLCDRYYYSTLAYQGLSTDYGWVKAMNLSCPEITRPDLCIYLDLLPAESLRRITAGRNSTEIYENEETLTGVRNRFLEVIEDLQREGEHIAVLHAAVTIEELAEKILTVVLPLLER